jgi:hypothetical protein
MSSLSTGVGGGGEREFDIEQKAAEYIFPSPKFIVVGGGLRTDAVMKKLSEVEEKLFMSSLDICPETCSKKGWGGE